MPTEKKPAERILKTVTFTQKLNIFGMLTQQVATSMQMLDSMRWDGEKVIVTSKHDVHSGQEVWILPSAIACIGWL